MRVDTEEERLLVVSDLHLGSPASGASRSFPDFVDGLRGTGWQLCINGDAFDVLQGTRTRLVRESLEAVRALQRYQRQGGRIYYVLGNHDLPLEHLLADLPITVVPFLNLTSGTRRIRIEHGHVYEPAYLRWPELYHLGGHLGGYVLAANADAYRLWSLLARAVHDRRQRHGREHPAHAAARQLFARGFDTVVLGHTHLPELVELGTGTYVNSGDWMTTPTCVRIEDGDVSLAVARAVGRVTDRRRRAARSRRAPGRGRPRTRTRSRSRGASRGRP